MSKKASDSLAFILCVATLLTSSSVFAQQIIGSDKYFIERLRGAESVHALDDHLFGDVINLKDGSLDFSQDDISVPTNSGLRLTFGRQSPKNPQGLDTANMPLGRAWEINAPYMVGRYDVRRGWDVSNPSGSSTSRCSSPYLAPTGWVGPSPDYNTRVMDQKMYWSGIHINIPGVGYESLLGIGTQNPRPADGTTYIGSTRQDWRVSCLSPLKNAAGEGFVVHLPNGEKYFFDWMATRDAPDVLSNPYYVDSLGNGTAPPYLLVPTADVFIYATRVEDRFGNSIAYNYDPSNPHHLVSIVSNEGSRIDISYGTNGKVSKATTVGRSWIYSYRNSDLDLSQVQLPDGSSWQFSGDIMFWKMKPFLLPGSFYDNTCAQNATGYRQSDPEQATMIKTLVITHPSGAVGTFKLRELIHGSDNTPGSCGIVGTSDSDFAFSVFGIPNAYVALSLVNKTISGVGGVSSLWTYNYSPHWSFQADCSQGCYSSTTVTEPSGTQKIYQFGNSYTDNFGELINESVVQGGVTKKSIRYARKSSTGDFPNSYGGILTPADDNPQQYKIRPVQTVEQTVDGVKFTRTINSFDVFARPLSVTKSNGPN